MPPTKLTRKELTHQRILDVAARAIRRGGFQGVGVADIMKEAGLTHGGYYAHFPSRDAMLVEAVAHAGQESANALAQHVKQCETNGRSPFAALVEAYLSEMHLAATDTGCPVAALVAEIPRQAGEVRNAAGRSVQRLIELVRKSLPPEIDPQVPMVVASTMVGALQVARALDDLEQATNVLAAARESLITRYGTSTTNAPAKD